LKLFSRNTLALLALIFPVIALAQPTVNAVVNNFGGVLPGLPNYGIPPGSLFVIYGTGLSASVPLVVQSSLPPGLPLTLNKTSISVIVNGKTTSPAIYYTSPTQIAAVLPSITPAGSGTITVTYNGQASAPAPLLVAPGAFGLLTLSPTGGEVQATDLDYNLILPTASAAPGQTIVLWGSGLGADTANDDRTYPQKQDNLKDATVYIGGVQAVVLYAGRSQFPGLDQIDVTVPPLGATPAFVHASQPGRDAAQASSGFQGGCGISLVVVAGGKASNFTTLPVNQGNGICVDPLSGITGTQLSNVSSQSAVTTASLLLTQLTQPSTTADLKPAQTNTNSYDVAGNFISMTGASYAAGSTFLSLQSCTLTAGNSSGNSGSPPGLDAGKAITLTGGGLSVQLPEQGTSGTSLGLYEAALSSPLIGGSSYSFKGLGGTQVGPFSVTVNFPVPLTWTNQNSSTTVTESQGLPITWTGGAPGTYVAVSGFSSPSTSTLSTGFTCFAPVGDQQVTVPPYVLDSMFTGSGSIAVYNLTNPVTFTATGLDVGSASAGVIYEQDVTFQ
jgi:uncharacterized protein (TIGR03437 family)